MNKELRSIACINVKNYVSQRQKDVRFFALATDSPRDDRDIVRQWCNGPLSPGFPRLTPVRCERMDCNRPVDILHLSEDNIWDYIYSHNWSSSSSLRICEGHLLRRILESLKDLADEGYIISHKCTRFETCCFPKNPTAIKFLNLYEKDMISEDVKISFCNFAINTKGSNNFLQLREIKEDGENVIPSKCQITKDENGTHAKDDKEKEDELQSENTYSVSDSLSSGPKSLPTNFQLIDPNSQKNTQDASDEPLTGSRDETVQKGNDLDDVKEENELKAIAVTNSKTKSSKEDFAQETSALRFNISSDTKLGDKNSTSDHPAEDSEVTGVLSKEQGDMDNKTDTKQKKTDEDNKSGKLSTVESSTKQEAYSNPNSPKCSQLRNPSSKNGYKTDSNPDSCNIQMSGHSVQVRVSKTSDMDADSKVTRSETAMVGQIKQRRRTHRKVDGPNKRATVGFSRHANRTSLEYDQFGRPKFKPSYEMVVDMAEFKFNRCSSDSDEDSDCDRDHGHTQKSNSKSKKSTKKKCKKKEKIREIKLLKTIDPEEHYGPSDSEEDEPTWLNGVPPAPVRADIKSLNSYFRTRRKLKYGESEKKIVFRKDSDYFPERLHSRVSFNQATLGSTQGMSYFNSQFTKESTGFPSSFSDLSLPQIPPSSVPSTTELDIKKASNEAVCGSHGKLCFINAFSSDHTSDGSSSSSSVSGDYGRGTMKLMNISLLNRIKTTYSNERIAEMYFKKTGEEYETKRRYARDAPKRRVNQILQKATAASAASNEEPSKMLDDVLQKTQMELERARLPSILRVPPTPNNKKVRVKPDPNRPIDAMYKAVKPGATIPTEHYQIKPSPVEDHYGEPAPLYFQQEQHADFRPYLLQAVQEFVIVKETVTRPAGRGTIVSLTITKPRRYKYGTAKQVCEEHGLYYDRVPNPPYPTPKNSEEPLATEEVELPTTGSSSADGTSASIRKNTGSILNEQLAMYADQLNENNPECPTGYTPNISQYQLTQMKRNSNVGIDPLKMRTTSWLIKSSSLLLPKRISED